MVDINFFIFALYDMEIYLMDGNYISNQYGLIYS